MDVAFPVVYEESYGLPAFSIEPDSEYQRTLRQRDSWNPITNGNVAVLASRAGRVVIGIDDSMVIKYTCFDNPEEFYALEDIGGVGVLGVPRPLQHWRCASDGRYAVSMTRLPGETFDDDSPPSEPAVLEEVSRSLRRILTSVRTLTSQTVRGPRDGLVRPSLLMCHGVRFSGVDDGVSLVEYLIRAYGSGADDSVVSRVRESYSEYLDGLPGRRDVFVMTHSDLHPNNVIAARGGQTVEVGLVDWERASYMPLYWEHLCACAVRSTESWRDAVIGATDQYPAPVDAMIDMISAFRQRAWDAN